MTSSYPTTFQGGLYQALYFKPDQELATSLSSSREILTLVCPYRDIQQRTLKAAEQQIRATRGRLEPKIVIIGHNASGANPDLKQWGRDLGLTVLPVIVDTAKSSSFELERALASELFSHNPFDVTGPIRDPSHFFGRPDLADIARRLRSGQIRSLFGIRKIGKTSALHRILYEAQRFHSCVCVMADCSLDSLAELDTPTLLESISAAVLDASESSGSYAEVTPVQSDASLADSRETLVHVLAKVKRPVVILLDEVDYISPSSPTYGEHWKHEFNRFFRAFRTAYQEACRRDLEMSVVVCGVSSFWFTTGEVDGVENAALAFVPDDYLGPFSRSHSVEMITQLGRSAGLRFPPSVAGQIAATCSDIPFWIRKACSYIYEAYPLEHRPLEPTGADIEELLDEFLDVDGNFIAYSSFQQLFRVDERLRKAALSFLSDGGDEPSARMISQLGRYGLLGEGRVLSGPMVRGGLKLWSEESVVDNGGAGARGNARPSVGRSEESGEKEGEELAELLAQVSRQRNLVEYQMREFVKQELRFAQRSGVVQEEPKDRVLKSLEERRRDEFGARNFGSMVKALYWQELVAVIKKNWKVFERYFHDRKEVEFYGDIVNDRPDAHANEIDQADVALQRRALGWFEERIAGAIE